MAYFLKTPDDADRRPLEGYPKRTYDFDRYAGGYSDHFPTYLVLLKQIDRCLSFPFVPYPNYQ